MLLQGPLWRRDDREHNVMTSSTIRSTRGRGRLFDSILDTVGDTPVIRINNLAPEGVRLYVKAEFFNPAASVKDRLAVIERIVTDEGHRLSYEIEALRRPSN